MGENASAKNARKAMLMLVAEVSINAIAALYELEEVLVLLHPKKLKILLLSLSFAS
jgi:flavoprotein